MDLKTVLFCFFSMLYVCFSQASELPSPFSKFQHGSWPEYIHFSKALLKPPNGTLLLADKYTDITFKTKMIPQTSELPTIRLHSSILHKTHRFVHGNLGFCINHTSTTTFFFFCRLTWPPSLSPYGRRTRCCSAASEGMTGNRGGDWWSTGPPVGEEPGKSTRNSLPGS